MANGAMKSRSHQDDCGWVFLLENINILQQNPIHAQVGTELLAGLYCESNLTSEGVHTAGFSFYTSVLFIPGTFAADRTTAKGLESLPGLQAGQHPD